MKNQPSNLNVSLISFLADGQTDISNYREALLIKTPCSVFLSSEQAKYKILRQTEKERERERDEKARHIGEGV